MRFDVPVVPDRESAHELLTSELQRLEYAERDSLLTRLINWFLEQLGRISWPDASLSGSELGVVITVVVVVVLAIAWLVAGPVRFGRNKARAAEVLDADDTRTAAQMRVAADTAALSADWKMATVERFRAIVRSLEERVIIEPRPGRTAQEAAASAAERLPRHATELVSGADLFDGVEYGDRVATSRDDADLRRLDAEITAARPAAPPHREPPAGANVLPQTGEQKVEKLGVFE